MISKFNTLHPLKMNLKYCERCGNLWLRRAGSKQALCNPCAEVEATSAVKGPVSFLQLWTRLRAEVEA